MNNNMMQECAHYFMGRPGFKRAFIEMKKKWVSYGRVTNSKIILKNATKEEKEALQTFLSRRFWEDSIEFAFSDFDKALNSTKFHQVSTLELLETYFGETLITNNQSKQIKSETVARFWAELNDWVKLTFPMIDFSWMAEMQVKGSYGFTYVSSLLNWDSDETEKIMKFVCKGMEILSTDDMDGLQLAVLAARVSGNPHYFDRGQRASQLLQYAICSKYHTEIPKSAEEVQCLYERAGIIVDKLSSTIIAYGVHIIKGEREYTPIEALKSFGEPMTLSLANLEDVDRIYADTDSIFVVENEMVYSHLLPLCAEKGIPFLCTSGQLSKAAQKVIRMLCSEGKSIFYSGDLDPEGLQIANELWKKYPKQIVMWRMGTEDYLSSMSDETISETRIKKLLNIENPDLQLVARMIEEQGKSGYQENIIELFENDLLHG